MKTIQYAHYLRPLLGGEEASKHVSKFVKFIKESKVEFDYIVVRGLSGVLMGTLVAVRMKKKLVIIRKETEGSHGFAVEAYGRWGDTMKGSFIIIDDLIDSGKTIETIFREIKEYHISCSGVFFYYRRLYSDIKCLQELRPQCDFSGFNPKVFGTQIDA